MENNELNTDNLLQEDNQDVMKPEEALVQKFNSFVQKIKENRNLKNQLHLFLRITVLVLAALLILSYLNYMIPGFQEVAAGRKLKPENDPELKNENSYKNQIASLQREIQRLSRRYSVYTPGQSYIVINTTDNRFFLYRNRKLIREGFCSSGSYIMLKTEGERKWIFKTPKGKYWIQGKITSPVWRKPDWAFVEEGLPIPPQEHPSRYEYGVLGDYAMSIGDGYLIHGTLYKRFLGMPVTHGCVRLNDEDLEAIYSTLSIGSKVYIF